MISPVENGHGDVPEQSDNPQTKGVGRMEHEAVSNVVPQDEEGQEKRGCEVEKSPKYYIVSECPGPWEPVMKTIGVIDRKFYNGQIVDNIPLIQQRVDCTEITFTAATWGGFVVTRQYCQIITVNHVRSIDNKLTFVILFITMFFEVPGDRYEA